MSGRLHWRGDALHIPNRRSPLLRLQHDAATGLYRIAVNGRQVFDVLNRTHARDAAISIAQRILTTEDNTKQVA